jgi:hypothetical protein
LRIGAAAFAGGAAGLAAAEALAAGTAEVGAAVDGALEDGAGDALVAAEPEALGAVAAAG